MRRKKKFGGFTVAGVPVKEEKNWGAQIAVSILLGVLFVGPWLVVLVWHLGVPGPASCNHGDCSTHASVALVAAIVAFDVLLLILIALRAVRNWRW